jgi:hypothetical protein
MLAVFSFAVAIGCGAGTQGQGSMDASHQPDAGFDAGSDAGNDAPAAARDAEPAVMDAASEHAGTDAGGVDGGPFACGTLTCAADEYCRPAVWATCFNFDGGPCPDGRSPCELAGGQMGCRAPCYSQGCTKTITFGCTVSNVPAPRWLHCMCE